MQILSTSQAFLLYFFVFAFGSIIGSFLNVVILRFNTGRSVNGRSGCFTCSKQLKWFELVPIVSYLFLRGKCAGCKTHISIQYPIVELVTAFLFVFLAYSDKILSFPGSVSMMFFVIDAAIWSTLIVIVVYDLRHMIIPDLLSVVFIALTFVRLFVLWRLEIFSIHTVLMYMLTALILSGFFFVLWLISKGRWIGLGDAKIAVGMGLYLGLAEGLSSFALAFWIGAAVALIKIATQKVMGKLHYQVREKSITMKSEIPFAPFLIFGMFLAYAFGSDIFHISLFFT